MAASSSDAALSASVISNLKKELLTNKVDSKAKTTLSAEVRARKLDKLQAHCNQLEVGNRGRSRLEKFLDEQKARTFDIESADLRHQQAKDHVTDEVRPVKASLERIEAHLGIQSGSKASSSQPTTRDDTGITAKVSGLLSSQSRGLPTHPWHKAREQRALKC